MADSDHETFLELALSELHARRDDSLTLQSFPRARRLLESQESIIGLLTYATQIGLFGLIHSAVKRWAKPELVDEIAKKSPEMDQFRTSHFAMTAFQKQELKELLSHFAKKSIDVIVLKGPLLAEAIYGDSFSRATADLDILVPDSSFELARSELLTIGYKESERLDEALNMDEYHHVVFSKDYSSGFKTAVELHVRIRSNRFGGVCPSHSDLAEDTDEITTPYCHRRFAKALLYGHFVLEVFKDGGSLKRIVDLEALRLGLGPSGERVRAICSKWGLSDALAYCEAILHNIRKELPSYETFADEQLLKRGNALLERIPPKKLFGNSNTSMRLLQGYYVLGGPIMAMRYILWWAIFPPPAVLARRFGMSSSLWIYLLYPISPFISLLYVLGLWRRTW